MMQDIIRGSSDIINKRAHDKNNINDNNHIDNNSNMNDSNINDIQSLLAKNQKQKSIASKHLHARRTTWNGNCQQSTRRIRKLVFGCRRTQQPQQQQPQEQDTRTTTITT